jgi:beta-lactamase regulating signal transducer with metallopeptidase domain
MNSWHSFGLTVLGQVTAITVVAAIAMAFAQRRAAARHAIGVVALIFLLASPMLTLLLPRARWLGGSESRAQHSDSGLVGAARMRSGESPPIQITPAAGIEREDAAELSTGPIPTQPGTGSATPRRINAPADEGKQLSPWTELVNTELATWLARGFTLIGSVWAVGVAILCRLFLSRRRQIRFLAMSLQPGAIDAQAAAEVRSALGFSGLPAIAISDLAPMPLVLGCRRPVVVLPRQLFEACSATRLRDILIHECAHILRRDPWINAAQHVAGLIFWPHPGVHWLNRQIARLREEVCDNFVLRQANSADYAQTLLELAEQCSRARFALSLLGIFSARWTLEQRISGILNPRREKMTRSSRTTKVMALMLLGAISLLVGGVGTWGQVSAEPAAQPKEKSPDARASAPPAAQATPAAIAGNSEKPDAATKKIAVRGVCQDQNSRPIPDVRVRVFRIASSVDPPKLVAEVRSGKDGKFSILDIETTNDPAHRVGRTGLKVAAMAKGYSSAAKEVDDPAKNDELSLVMSNNPGTLSGVVTDVRGRPVQGVAVFLPFFDHRPLPDFNCAITDVDGHFAITDFKRWQPGDAKPLKPKPGEGYTTDLVISCYFMLRHPDYAVTRGSYSGIPQEVNVTLSPPAIVEGRVIDQVSSRPLVNVVVHSQGVGRSDGDSASTDQQGRYRLVLNKDHYNIWAEADDRIAIAVKALPVEPGKTVKDADIRMVRGGFVVGTVIDGTTGKPIAPAAEKVLRVAQYGPARPRTGAAVTSTAVNPDGTYRLRVAPGRNYVYLMNGAASAIVNVEDGQEVKLDLRIGDHVRQSVEDDDPDVILAQKLRREALEEDAEQSTKASGAPAQPPKRQRPGTPTGRLLNKLEEQNASPERFKDSWLRTLKEIVGLGSAAVPELAEELDATDNGMMMRCLGFSLRAIGDKRAVPALIRAIPKTLIPPGSDMGLRSEDAELAKFAQQHELNEKHEGKEYDFGRPVREIFGALQKLTGQHMGEEELFHAFLEGTTAQKRMKRDLFYRTAKKWSDWWERNASDSVKDSAYARVNLAKMPVDAVEPARAETHYKTVGGGSNWILESVFDPKPHLSFYDLDTGRAAELPEKWRDPKTVQSHLDEILAWAANEGFDLMGVEYIAPDGERTYALRSIGLRAWELGRERWKMDSDDIKLETLQKEGTPVEGLLLHRDIDTKAIDPKAIATFFYITREGTPGLLFVGIEVKDDSLKPGGFSRGDNELDSIAFQKGRRFGYREFEDVK